MNEELREQALAAVDALDGVCAPLDFSRAKHDCIKQWIAILRMALDPENDPIEKVIDSGVRSFTNQP